MIKKIPKFIFVTNNPVLIVGERMGKQRVGEDKFALEGNRTGDFVHEAIGDQENIILTNIHNYLYPGKFTDKFIHHTECMYDLKEIILCNEPCKIICLGAVAAKYVKFLLPKSIVVVMPHPSYINRFQSSLRPSYIKWLSNEIKQRVPANT